MDKERIIGRAFDKVFCYLDAGDVEDIQEVLYDDVVAKIDDDCGVDDVCRIIMVCVRERLC